MNEIAFVLRAWAVLIEAGADHVRIPRHLLIAALHAVVDVFGESVMSPDERIPSSDVPLYFSLAAEVIDSR